MRHRNRVVLLAGIGAVFALLSGCAASTTVDTPSVALSAAEEVSYTAAKAEPALTWYSSQDPSRNEAVIAAFEKRFPALTVTTLRLASGALATRFAQEEDAGVHNAGLVTVASPVFVATGQTAGWFKSFDATEYPGLAALPARFFEKGAATTGISPFGIGYNTSIVTSPPKTWQDVLAPSYAGKIILGDPRNVPAYVALGRVWLDAFGPEFLEKVAAQKPTIVDSMVPGTQQLAAGEGALGLPSVVTVLEPLIDAGAPLDYVIPDLTTGNEFASVLASQTTAPETASLLYQFLLTDEGQEAFNGKTSVSPTGAAGTAAMPKEYVSPRIAELPAYQDRILSLLGITR